MAENYTPADEEEEIVCAPSAKDDFIIAVSSNEMGQGEKALGQTLIKAFLFAVTKQDKLPSKVLFYNSGAYLTCEDSDSLEDLKKIRYDSENVLKNIYDICDITKPKAIKIENKALVREVDIVIAKWYKDADSVLNDKKEKNIIQQQQENKDKK